jgi:hypothetical protein
VFAGWIWFIFNLLGLALTPYNYARLREAAARGGAIPARSEADMITGAIRTLLEQACLFTAPFILWLVQLRGARAHLSKRRQL